MENDLGPRLQVGRVLRGVEVLVREVQRVELERPVGRDLEAVAGLVGEPEPAHVGLVPVLLRHDVGHVLVGDRALVDVDRRAGLPVGVVVPRPAAVPGELLEVGAQAKLEADARQVAEVGRELNAADDLERPVLEERVRRSVADVVPAVPTGERVDGLDGRRRPGWGRRGPRARSRAGAGGGRGRASARGRGRGRPAGDPDLRVSLSVGARQMLSDGPRTTTLRPPKCEICPVALSITTSVPPWESVTCPADSLAANVFQSPAAGAGLGRDAAGPGIWSQAARYPAGAQGVSPRVTKRKLDERLAVRGPRQREGEVGVTLRRRAAARSARPTARPAPRP